MLTVGFKNVDQVGSFFDKLKAPTDYKRLAQATHRLAKLAGLPQDKFTADAVVDTLALVHADDLTDALTVARAMDAGYVSDTHYDHVDFVRTLAPALADVGFKDLTADQQATLKGKAIGDALRDIKVARTQDALDTAT